MPSKETEHSAAADSAEEDQTEFQQLADSRDPTLVCEFWQFLREDKKWWLTPIIAIMLLLAALAFLSTSPAAPFIYTIF